MCLGRPVLAVGGSRSGHEAAGTHPSRRPPHTQWTMFACPDNMRRWGMGMAFEGDKKKDRFDWSAEIDCTTHAWGFSATLLLYCFQTIVHCALL